MTYRWTYRFQSRFWRGEFLTIQADDLDHARQLIRKQGENPLHWRSVSYLSEISPRR